VAEVNVGGTRICSKHANILNTSNTAHTSNTDLATVAAADRQQKDQQNSSFYGKLAAGRCADAQAGPEVKSLFFIINSTAV
jgi:hypothetical protein